MQLGPEAKVLLGSDCRWLTGVHSIARSYYFSRCHIYSHARLTAPCRLASQRRTPCLVRERIQRVSASFREPSRSPAAPQPPRPSGCVAGCLPRRAVVPAVVRGGCMRCTRGIAARRLLASAPDPLLQFLMRFNVLSKNKPSSERSLRPGSESWLRAKEGEGLAGGTPWEYLPVPAPQRAISRHFAPDDFSFFKHVKPFLRNCIKLLMLSQTQIRVKNKESLGGGAFKNCTKPCRVRLQCWLAGLLLFRRP